MSEQSELYPSERRKDFEKWLNWFLRKPIDLYRDANGEYRDDQISFYWQAYKAGRRNLQLEEESQAYGKSSLQTAMEDIDFVHMMADQKRIIGLEQENKNLNALLNSIAEKIHIALKPLDS